ncbi:hypothetical protein [Ancylobacter amanitiformis]|uniref:Uncharacterized protein n=1 Tax=Ancylobacter amanitiformis TaxID=217069 RepID=A0ABU0LPZ9_9HYPH|nr:hypothetical protein [Ancylobacter amanitiformis]MDQ0510749.1 hypothetical protein [Ancylobacter amanitiformis]
MHNTRINRTDVVSIRPLGAAVRSEHALLVSLLEELGPDASGLLAEPVYNRDGSVIDWYVPGRVVALDLVSAPAEIAESVTQSLAELGARIHALADRIERQGHAEDREMARLLRDCLTVPSRSCIFVVDGKPVLTAWGHVTDNGQAVRTGLRVLEPRRPVAPPTPPAAAAPPMAPAPGLAAAQTAEAPLAATAPRWPLVGLLWLLFAVLIAAIMYLLLKACAFGWLFFGFGFSNYCPAGPIATMDRLSGLGAQVAALEQQLAQAPGACAAGAIGGAGASGEAALPDAEATLQRERDARAGLQTGDLEITLLWDGTADLDLSAQFLCPSGPQAVAIDYRTMSICGGVLDRDNNANRIDPAPAEHITFPNAETVPSGPIDVGITLYNRNRDTNPDIPYKLVIRRGSDPPRIIEGAVNASDTRQRRSVETIRN